MLPATPPTTAPIAAPVQPLPPEMAAIPAPAAAPMAAPLAVPCCCGVMLVQPTARQTAPIDVTRCIRFMMGLLQLWSLDAAWRGSRCHGRLVEAAAQCQV